MIKSDLISEEFYILKRKVKALCYSLLFYGCRIFPIERKKIVLWSFEGTQGFCCNPKYIAEELLKRNLNNNRSWKLVWLVDDEKQVFPKGIKKIKNTTWNRVFQLSTAGCWIGNSRTFYGTKKRKKQLYIQTWHGTIAIKPIGKYRGKLFPRMAYLVSKTDSKLTDYVLSGSTWCDTHYRKGLVYDGTIIRTGTPRCDILVDEDKKNKIKEQIKKKYKVAEGVNILLYAPTFRGGSQSTKRTIAKEEIKLDFERILDCMEKRFGGKWILFTRLHPQLAAKNEDFCMGKRLEGWIDVTHHPDMNELIAAADGFISDYSSAIFEAALLEIPCFIFADDLEDYVQNRGDLFFYMYKLPFPVALKNDELIKNIECFDFEIYVKEVRKFMNEQGVVELGDASKKVVDLIEREKHFGK
ncbi:MAG: hypothetical protein HFH13_01605 [Dorea sp.]|nr:hypothetical protein [Dorea sp.]